VTDRVFFPVHLGAAPSDADAAGPPAAVGYIN